MSRRRKAAQMILVDVDADQVMTPDGFQRLLTLTLEAEVEIFPARTWGAATVGHPCDRYSVWRFIRWREQSPARPVLQSIFDQGDDIQPLIYDRLEQMGFDLIRESDRPVQYEPRRGLIISGRFDGKIMGWRGTRYRPERILEAKSCSEWVFDSIDTIEDVRKHPSHRIRSYYVQANIYAFLENLPHGALALYSKATGMMKLIPFDLDYDLVEGLLKRIDRLQPFIDRRQDPPPIAYDPDICRSCAYGRICYPPRSYGEGAQVIDDQALIDKLERLHALAPNGREWKRLDQEVKDQLKHLGIGFAVAGDFTIEGTQRRDGAVIYRIAKLGDVDGDE